MKEWLLQHRPVLLGDLIVLLGLALTFTCVVYVFAATPAPPPPAPEKTSTPAAAFVGSETCAQCHGEVQEQLNKHFHGQAMMSVEKKGKGYQCEGCHGPGSVHAGDPSKETAAPLISAAREGKGCLSCHSLQLSPTKWKRSDHHRAGVGCIYCHTANAFSAIKPIVPEKNKSELAKVKAGIVQPHGDLTRSPSSETCLACHGDKVGEFSLPFHHPVKEGRIGCADCHNPHQPMGKEMQKRVCLTCHVKQSGPFRFEHGAISGHLTDACLDCHRPHGSPNRSLLKFTNRGLCLQCHGDRVTHFPGQNCLDCHKAVHGSNTSRLLFTE